jgi:hypothetical protein
MLSRFFNNTYYEANEDMKCNCRFECSLTRSQKWDKKLGFRLNCFLAIVLFVSMFLQQLPMLKLGSKGK